MLEVSTEKQDGLQVPDYENFERDWLTVHPDGYGSGTPKALCEKFANFFRAKTHCLLVTVWSVNPKNEHLLLIAHSSIEDISLPTNILHMQTCLCGEACLSREVVFIPDVTTPRGSRKRRRKYLGPRMVGLTSLRSMISVPVRNIGNPHQILLVINFFPATNTRMAAAEVQNHPSQLAIRQELEITARRFAARFEECLLDYGIRHGNRLQLALSKVSKDQVKQRFKTLALHVREAVGCDSVVIYVQRSHEQSLVQRGSVGVVLPFEATSRVKGSPAEVVFKSNRESLYRNLVEAPGMSAANRENVNERQPKEFPFAWAFVPLQDLSGQAKGVIRCLNTGLKDTIGTTFTFEDLAVIEALGRAFAPHLDVILADERRVQEMDFVAHELRVPVTAFRAVVERVKKECHTKGYTLDYPHFNEIDIYTSSMSRLLTRLDLTRKGPYRVELSARETNFEVDIIAPAKRFLTPLLNQKSFRSSQITFSQNISEFPLLLVDPVLLTQVVFNLIENSIKYFDGKKRDFKLRIDCSWNDKWCELRFIDNGIGIEPNLHEKIFELTFRGPDRRVRREKGEGMGLWYAREVIIRHGGDISVEPAPDGTTFLIRLPRRLETSPPLQALEEESD